MKKRISVFVLATALALICAFPALQASAQTPKTEPPYLVGPWLTSDQAFFDQWMAKLTREAKSSKEPLLPVIEEFKNIIEEDPQLYMLFHQMFEQVPQNEFFSKDPTGSPQIQNY
jgi:phosphatidylserine decarboxylase